MLDETKPSNQSQTDHIDVYSEVDSLNSLAWSLHDSDIERALELATNARLMSLNTRIPYNNGAAYSNKTLGVLHLQEHRYEQALSHFLEAFDIYKILDFKEEQLQVHKYIATLYMWVEAYIEASVYYKSALSFAREINDIILIVELLIELVKIDMHLEQHRSGQNRLSQILELLKNLNLDYPNEARFMEAQAHYLLSQLAQHNGEYNDSHMYGLDALALLTPKEIQLQIDILMHLGHVNSIINDTSGALLYYERSLELSRQNDLHHAQIEATIKINAIYIQTGDIQDALKRLERLKKYVRERGTLLQREQVQHLLAQAYKELGLHQQAIPYLTRLIELKEFRFERDQQRRTAQHSQLHRVKVRHLQKFARRNKSLGVGTGGELLTKNAHVDLLREQLEQEIQKREVLIEELNAFSYTVAHDLKSPLNVISGFTNILNEALADYTDLAPDIPKSLAIIEKTTHKMDAIIEDLMLLAGVRDQDHVTYYPIDMNALIDGVEQRLSYEIQASDATIIKPDVWIKGIGYGPWVEAIWVNYISNAIKYGGTPPVITLGTENVDGSMVRYWVKDNGEGVPQAQHGRVFTQFNRLQENLTKGHGIGLSIVKRIASRLGGTVGIENPPEGGSLFYFTLPLAEMGMKEEDDD